MKRTRQEKLRLLILFTLMALFFVLVTIRLLHFQVVKAAQYREIVNDQSTGTVEIPADRGVIYDRNGRVVANNVYQQSLVAYPETKEEVKNVARYIEKLLGRSRGTAIEDFGLAPNRFRKIKRAISDAMAAKVEANAPRGLYLRQGTRRDYPFATIGKQILGFTNADNKEGQSGLEYSCNKKLAGKPGKADYRRDGLRNTYRVREQALIQPVPGQSMVLTVDWHLQEIIEEELQAAVIKHKAKSGMAAFVDCNNGDILAMAHFDPNEKNPHRPVKARVVTDQFEPGSIFKVFGAAALLDRGMVNYAESTYCEMGKFRLGRKTLHDDKKLEWLNFREIIELSSNIGISKHAISLGGEAIQETCQKFGLGQKLLDCMPGETGGKIKAPSRWSEYNTAAFTIGHSVAVSTLQMAVAFAAIANGGELLKPRLIFGGVDEDGYVVRSVRREVVGRAMKENSSDSLRAFLRGVVERGTAKPVNSAAVTIAGKTGTAQIYDVVNKRYYSSKYMGSFAGFFPAENPLVAGIVVIEEPHPIHYGGYTAGPAFRSIAERYTVLNPDLFASQENVIEESEESHRATVEVPDLSGYTPVDALAKVVEAGLEVRCEGSEGNVVWQFPSPDRLLFEGDDVLVVVGSQQDSLHRMIDLKGLSLREVAAFCGYAGVAYEVTGKGRVVRQSIEPGSPIEDKSLCRLVCKSI
ncbi:MAG: penicillin-binding transpeptidase domain-containing protein [bacterium]|nr:penicillin-binding transpeptidase domain-containing protein [bacterium]